MGAEIRYFEKRCLIERRMIVYVNSNFHVIVEEIQEILIGRVIKGPSFMQ